MQNYSILVNTCDKFDDCWEPFFKLFSIYWPDYKGKIYLNTEYKDYSYPGLNIIAVKGCEKNNIPRSERATWSQCLKWALETIEDEVILYMQEDYFLKDTVKDSIIGEFADKMYFNKDIHCIHITDQAVIPEYKSEYENLYVAKLRQRFRLSCQAALWQKSILRTYIREYESAWEFEEFGSKRAIVLNHNFYVVDKNWVKLNEYELLPHVFTGIIQGHWYEEVVPLFEKHAIVVDYSIRGFVNDAPKKPFMKRVLYNWHKIPKLFKHYSDISELKANKEVL